MLKRFVLMKGQLARRKVDIAEYLVLAESGYATDIKIPSSSGFLWIQPLPCQVNGTQGHQLDQYSKIQFKQIQCAQAAPEIRVKQRY